jgi:hypothetical protein
MGLTHYIGEIEMLRIIVVAILWVVLVIGITHFITYGLGV